MKLDVLTLDNKKSSVLELDKSVFEAEIRADILHRMVTWQLAKRRAGTRKTQERSEVTGSRAKIIKQKDDIIAIKDIDGNPALVTDQASMNYLTGSKVHWKEDLSGAAFVIDNPNATSSCGCGTSFSVI